MAKAVEYPELVGKTIKQVRFTSGDSQWTTLVMEFDDKTRASFHLTADVHLAMAPEISGTAKNGASTTGCRCAHVASCGTSRERTSHGDEEEKANRAPSEMSRQEMPLVYVGQYAHKRERSARPIHQGSPRAVQRRHRRRD